jgi:hypothetical protein
MDEEYYNWIHEYTWTETDANNRLIKYYGE